MSKRDLGFSLTAALVTAVFLLPTLANTGFYNRLPFPLILLFIIFPIIAVFGMFVAYFIGRKIAIIWQLAKFAFVGVLNTAIDFGILNLLMALAGVTSGVGIILMNATSFSTAVVNSYFWNRGWVFSASKRNNFIIFVAVTLIGLSINTGVVYVLTTFVPPILVKSATQWANLAKILATGLSLIWNFAGYKLVVFKK